MKISTLVKNVAELTDANEIDKILAAVKVARNNSALVSALTFSKGMKVFVVQKTKKTLGEIVKVNRTRCVVKMKGGNYTGTNYNVPNSMLVAA